MKRTATAARYETTYMPLPGHMVDRVFGSEAITVSCYENDVPAFVEADMDRLYGSIYSSLVQFRIVGDGTDTSTYIVRKGGKAITVFLFQRDNGNVRVINEVIRVEKEDITRFADYIFSTFSSASVISFKAIQTDIHELQFPFQRFNHLEDIVLTLPDSIDEYLGGLGKNTRRNIKRYSKKLNETFPSFQYRVCIEDENDERTIEEIVDLNKARMAGKNKVSAIDRQEAGRIVDLVKACGLAGIATIDGRVCAGAIAYRAGSNYFLSVIAHDPQYDSYWLGILCCYFTICECIKRGGREFHFLWGEYEYKYTLLGVKRDLDNFVVYRSRMHMALNGKTAFYTAFKGYARLLRLRLHDAKRQDTPLARLALASLNGLRSLRQFKQAFLAWRK